MKGNANAEQGRTAAAEYRPASTNPTELRGLEVVGLLFLDRAGRVLDADVQARRILQGEVGSLLGRRLPELLAGPNETRAEQALRRAAASGENVDLAIPFATPSVECVAVAAHPAPSGFTVPIRHHAHQWQHTVGRRLRERVLGSIASGIAVLDARADGYPIRYANEAFGAVAGAAPDELTGRALDALFAGEREARDDAAGEGTAPPRGSQLAAALAKAREGTSVELELPLRRADGSGFWGFLSLSPVEGAEGSVRFLVLALRDVTERVRAHEALAASERRYRLLAERSSDIVARHDPQGNPLYVSPALQRILGFEPEAYVARNAFDFVHPDDLPEVRARLAALEAGSEPASAILFRMRHVDGHYVWIEMSVTVVRDRAGEVAEIVSVSRDVSDRVGAQRELARSQESFRRLFAENPLPMWVHDTHTLETLEVNGATLELLGYDRDAFLHTPTTAFVAERHRDAYLAAVRAMPEGLAHLHHVVVRASDGSEIIVALDKSPIRFDGREARLVVARDVTAARRAERELERSERRFRRLVERSSDVIAVTDNAGMVTYISEAVEGIVGYRPEELMGRSLGRFIHPDDHAAVQRFRADIDAHGTARIPLYRFRRRDGGWCWFEATGRDLRDDPAVEGVVINTRDVSERVAQLREIEATREATFRALGLALEYRDLETRGHTDRVVTISRRFAAVLGFDGEQLQAITWGAYLHDLGKVAMPDQILLKPGRLTEEEFAVIRRHTLIGEDMCRGIPFLPATTRELIRSHHERWDGGGYPDGLAGEAIPLKARMFAIVDVFDALTSERPYKRAWSVEETVAELKAQAGSQFDPALVEVFLERVLPQTGA